MPKANVRRPLWLPLLISLAATALTLFAVFAMLNQEYSDRSAAQQRIVNVLSDASIQERQDFAKRLLAMEVIGRYGIKDTLQKIAETGDLTGAVDSPMSAKAHWTIIGFSGIVPVLTMLIVVIRRRTAVNE